MEQKPNQSKNTDRWSAKLDPADKEYIINTLSENEDMVAADLIKEFVKLHKELHPSENSSNLDFSNDLNDLNKTFKAVINIISKITSAAQTAVIETNNSNEKITEELKKEIQNINGKNKELEDELENKNLELEKTEEFITSKEKELKEKNKEKQDLWNKYQKELGNANKWFQWYEKADSRAEKAEEKIETLKKVEKENIELEKNKANLEVNIENLKLKLNEEKESKNKAEANSEVMQAKLEEIKEKANQKINEIEIRKAEETAKLKERIENLQNQIKKQNKEKNN